MNKIFEQYFKENKKLLEGIMPPEELEDYIDVEDLPEDQRYKVYTAFAKTGQEFTDQELEEYLSMIKTKKDKNEELGEIETNFVLSRVGMEMDT